MIQRDKLEISSGLYGLVLAGGRSKRMHRDKSLISYHGKPQIIHCYELLHVCCERVFISNRVDQKNHYAYAHLPQIHDRFQDVGPLGGIVSAMLKYPDRAWFILACDLPMVKLDDIRHLIMERAPSRQATVFENPVHFWPEPLCAIYEPSLLPILLDSLKAAINCPRKILMNTDIHLIQMADKKTLYNVNDLSDFMKIKGEIPATSCKREHLC